MTAAKEVLIIDDDELFRGAFEVALNEVNIRVAKAKDATEGLKMAEEIHPKLIVVDQNMPGLSGFEFIKKLRTLEWANDINVFMFTIEDDINTMNAQLQAGVVGFLDKASTTPEQAAAVIQKHLGNHPQAVS